MSDNVQANAGTGGATFAADDIGGVYYARSKQVWGPDGSANDVDIAANKALPVQLRVADGTAFNFAAGAVASGTQRVTLGADDPAVVTLGATSGTAVVTDANGTIQQYLRGIVKFLVNALGAGTAAAASRVTLASDDPGVVQLKAAARMFAITASAVTRPADTNAYAANDAVSNSVTAGSVAATSFTLSDTADHPIALERMRLASNDTAATLVGKSFRAWLYRENPTLSSGVVGGDNSAFSTKQGEFIGTMSGSFRGFSDGAVAVLTPDEGARIISKPSNAGLTVFALFQTLEAYTPGTGKTFTATLEGRQGRP